MSRRPSGWRSGPTGCTSPGSTLGFGGDPARAIEAAAAHVLERGGRLSLDPNVRSADARLRVTVARLARSAHVLFPSEGELAALSLDPRELAGRGALVCETRGRDGALLYDGGEPVQWARRRWTK